MIELAAIPDENSADVSVVICCYTERRWSELRDAVESVVGQSPRPAEVIVVIDHNDLLLAAARQRWSKVRWTEPTPVVVVPNQYGRGLSGARNTGAEVSTGRLIAFLDDDATARPGWLAALSTGIDRSGAVAAGGPVHPVTDGPVPRWWPAEFNWVIGCTWPGLPTTEAPVRNMIGCNMAFRRDAVLAVGGFREGIGRIGTSPTGCEETDLCIRLGAATGPEHGEIQYLPDAQVDHRVPFTRLQWAYFRRRCWAEGRSKATIVQHNGSRTALATEHAYATRTLPKAIVTTVARGEIRRAAAIVAGLVLTTAGYVRGSLTP